MTGTVRAFVAIELPDHVRQALHRMQGRLGSERDRSAKWVAPEGIHLTLHFFGDVAVELVPGISGALGRAAARSSPIPLCLAGAGCFPNVDRPRVLWVGLGGDTQGLARLQREVEAQLAGLGYRPEARAFSPHLTLARVRDTAMPEDLRRLGQAMRGLAVPATAFAAESVALIRSDLRPTGAVYTTLTALTLGGEATPRPG